MFPFHTKFCKEHRFNMLRKNYATGPVQLPASYGEFKLSGIIFIILSSCIGEVEWKAGIYQNQQICTSVLRPLQLSAADLALKTKLSAASLCKGRRQQSSLQLSDPSSGENQGLLYCRVRKVLPLRRIPKQPLPLVSFLDVSHPPIFSTDLTCLDSRAGPEGKTLSQVLSSVVFYGVLWTQGDYFSLQSCFCMLY